MLTNKIQSPVELLQWIAMVALHDLLSRDWPRNRFWGRPVKAMSEHYSYRVSEPWCHEESPLLVVVPERTLAQWVNVELDEIRESVRQLVFHAVEAEYA